MRVFISAGEPSGDLHGSNLVKALQANGVKCFGFGGAKMREAGCQIYQDLTPFAVMFLQALKFIPQMWRYYRQADRIFSTGQIDAVVLIDFPGFNWWVAKAAKRHGVPVFYYGVPQMWGWLPWRVRKLRRLVDHVLCKLPFEVPWFAARGVSAHYVGHPYFDELAQRSLDPEFMQEYRDAGNPLVTLLPGSRNQEVSSNIDWLLETAIRIRRQIPTACFAVACYNPAQAAQVRHLVSEHRLEIDVFVNRTPELIELATVCVACSGSVSLELMYHQKPSVIVYRLKRIQAIGKWLLMTCRFITLVNLLATDDISRSAAKKDESTSGDPNVPFPEFPWCANPSVEMAAIISRWLQEPAELERRERQLAELKEKYAQPGATDRAAQYILEQLFTRKNVEKETSQPDIDQDLPSTLTVAAAAALQGSRYSQREKMSVGQSDKRRRAA